ncbi:MAG: hypothetical protein LR005_01715, partial [Candidatus Pacebacteria bacterium]|nr:hypothetical protein [Candidatus Paceibacterota bacterium]
MEDKKNNNEAKDGKEKFYLPSLTEKRLAGILKKLKEGTHPSDLSEAEKKALNEIGEYMETPPPKDVDNIVFSIDGVNQSDLNNL